VSRCTKAALQRKAPDLSPKSAAAHMSHDTGKIDLAIPRDRLATFDPQLIAKYQRRFPGF
jgi:transposase-like protein